MGLTVQPSILEQLRGREAFRGEGLLGRFLYGVPDARIGERLTGAAVPALDGVTQASYTTRLMRLLEAPPAEVDEHGKYVPHVLELSEGARDVFFAFEAEVERALAPGGKLHLIPDWGAKLHGQVARIAGLLTLAARMDRPGQEAALWRDPLPERRMTDAARIGRALIHHARHALLDVVEVDPELRLARYVLGRLRDFGPEEMPTANDLFERVRGKKGLGRMKPLNRILRRLEDHNFVRVAEQHSPGPGRKPSPRISLNPKVRKSIRKIRRKAEDSDLTDSTDGERENGSSEDANSTNSTDADGDSEA